jgi:ketosteroid isomerase-like protein
MSTRGRFVCGRRIVFLVSACLILATASGLSAGQNQKNKKSKDPAPAASADQTLVGPPAPDTDQIDHDIGEMLAGFQIGDVAMMHKYYSDNVTFVSGDYSPAIKGWATYVPLYQRQRAAFQGMQLIRRNTLIFVRGDFGWATYQWEFDSTLNGQPYSALGQTTLVFNKVGADWLIVHNHTSEVSATQAQTAAPAGAKP